MFSRGQDDFFRLFSGRQGLPGAARGQSQWGAPYGAPLRESKGEAVLADYFTDLTMLVISLMYRTESGIARQLPFA